MARLCLVIQKASSPLIELTFIFLLCFVPEPALCSPLTAGVDGTVQMFCCQGCAVNVTKVFCNDENLLDHSHIPNCSHPLQPNSVCQCNGWVIASTNTGGDCEFEGEINIKTVEIQDFNNICRFNVNQTGRQKAPEDHITPILIGVAAAILLLVLAAVGVLCFCKNRQTRQLNLKQPSDPGETEALEMEQ